MSSWRERLDDALFVKSRDLPPPWGPPLRVLRYPAALIRDWLAGEIGIRAMSLAYTTILSLVPLLVFIISVMKGLGARADMRYVLHQFLRPLGAAADQLTENILQFVANMRGDVLGTIGFAFLAYTVMTTIQKVEASFNFVWRVSRPRSIARRLAEYLAVMTVGPILLAVAVGLLGSAQHSPFAQWLDAIPPLAWTMAALGQLMPYVVVAIAFALMYGFVPDTHVEARAALIGGMSAGVVWALVGRAFAAFILYSSHMVAVYTSFAIVVTTLIWVYLSWLILLIGAQLAFYVQCPQYLRHGQEPVELTVRGRERAGLAVMYLIAHDHRLGKVCWTPDGLAQELDVPGLALAPVLACLERGGLIAAAGNERLEPARDPAAIRLVDIVDAIRTDPLTPAVEVRGALPVDALMSDMEAAVHLRLSDRTLGDWVAGVTLPRWSSPRAE